MMSEHDIHSLHGSIFHVRSMVDDLVREAVASEDPDDHDRLLYAIAQRLIGEWQLTAAKRLTDHLKTWGAERVWLWGEIATKLGSLGRHEDALKMVQEAVGLIDTLDESVSIRADALVRIGKHLAELGEKDRAAMVWIRAIGYARESEEQGDIDGSSVLWTIAEQLVLAGQWDQGREVAHAIVSPGKRERAITRIEAMINSASQFDG
jgi:tetratricopeptide (TPR) repeat protein